MQSVIRFMNKMGLPASKVESASEVSDDDQSRESMLQEVGLAARKLSFLVVREATFDMVTSCCLPLQHVAPAAERRGGHS